MPLIIKEYTHRYFSYKKIVFSEIKSKVCLFYKKHLLPMIFAHALSLTGNLAIMGIHEFWLQLLVGIVGFGILPTLVLLIWYSLQVPVDIYNRQQAIIERLETSEGIQFLKIYGRLSEQGKNMMIYAIVRNDDNLPIRVSGEVLPVEYKGVADTQWKKTKYDGLPFFSDSIVIEPKKTEEIRLAMTDVDKDGFFIDASMNILPVLVERGYYCYRLRLNGINPDSKKYYNEILGYLQYWGGTQLSYVEKLSD